MKQYLSFLFFSVISFAAMAQTATIIGKVVDVNGKAMASVNIKTLETNQYTVSNENGSFKLIVNLGLKSTLNIDFSFLGYQKQTKQVQPNTIQIDLGNITLRELNLSLETIEVNANRNYEGSSNSSLIISRDIIEQIPSLSLSDLLNQIPNKKIVAPSLQNVQNLTLRGAFSAVSSGRNIYEMNNAFGIAIIVDGNTISNNMNMQTFNTGLRGSADAQSNIRSNSFGLNGSPSGSYSGDFAFGGLDLRQIPADNIESIEVIAGVPSAKYGDLTEGAIVVERQAGKSPAYIRMQLRDNATSYGFSKGFGLGKKLGNLNVGVNYVNSFADNRDKIKAYKRLNLSTMHTNYYGAGNRLKNTISVDYGRNLDGVKRDKDDLYGTLVKFDSWNFSISNRTSYRLDHKFLKNIGLNLRYANGHQISYTEAFRNEAYILVSDATATGIHEGSYQKGIYTSQSLIDGRPLNISAKLDFNSEFKTGRLNHFLSYGAGYSYGANNGLGQVLDPSRPRVATSITGNTSSTSRSERYYDFRLAIPQQDVGFYVEDMFTSKIFNKNLNVRAGMRYDIQNNLPSFSPRININYELSKSLRFGLAYGISFKSPALGQRYPGPTYFEIPVINAYNGNVNESIYLVYVNRYDPTATGLKPANSETFEFSSQIKVKKYNISLNAFHKDYSNGIGNLRNDKVITLPTYTATFQPGTNKQPVLTETGTKTYRTQYYSFANNLSSNSQGFDVIITTPEYKPIATSFSVSGGLYRSQSKSENFSYQDFDQTNVDPNYALTGIYPSSNNISFASNGRITSTTHIPKISLFIQAIAEFTLLQKTIRKGNQGIPIAYYTKDNRYVQIIESDRNNPSLSHLYKTESEMNVDNLPAIIPNFHLSIGKEIKKRFKIAFNVYNFLNYQPYYIDSGLSYRYPNQAPTFGAELSLKL